MKPISSRMSTISLSPIKDIERTARKLTNVISLAQGIPAFPPPTQITQTVIQHLSQHQAHTYTVPEGRLSLRKKIAQDILKRSQTHYNPETEILITGGAMAAIQATLLTLLNPGDEVVVLTPAYASYFGQIRSAGGVPICVSMRPENQFRLCLEDLKQAIRPKTKAILFANPNNPTGVNLQKQELQQILELALQHNLYVIADEVYRDFVWQGQHTPAASFPELKPQLISVFGFSKTYAITGYRVGYLATSASLANQILKVHDNMMTCAPHPAQIAAEAALELNEKEKYFMHPTLLQNRTKIHQTLNQLPHFQCHLPHAGYYLFAKLLPPSQHQPGSSTQFSQFLLQHAQVATVPGNAFGQEGYLRLSFALPPQQLETALKRIQKLLQSQSLPPTHTQAA
ncbi:MAG: pyridoxal phosphate-dependent aminotransferase [Planctomycetota bacterium]|nr:MAG: pyridoxal phosphate-dependent aminotransferase [Planctomycetota bacterium]